MLTIILHSIVVHTYKTSFIFKNSRILTNFTQQQPFTWLFLRNNPGEAAPEHSETLSQYTTLIVLKFLTSTPNLSSQASYLTLGSHTKVNLEETDERNIRETRTCTSFILA